MDLIQETVHEIKYSLYGLNCKNLDLKKYLIVTLCPH